MSRLDKVVQPKPYTLAGRQALIAWRVCGGYFPERLPVCLALHDDLDTEPSHLLALLAVIHGVLKEHDGN